MALTWFASYRTRGAAANRRFAACLLVMMIPVAFPYENAAAPGGKTEVLPIQKAAPAAVVIETAGNEVELRRHMRAKTGVVELKTEKVRFSQAPTGSFGFIAPPSLGIALVMQSADLELDKVAPVANAYEVHKLADGSGLLVGFMGKELAPEVSSSERPHTLRIAIYSNPLGKAPLIVAVPIIKLMVDRMPTRIEPKKLDSAVMLEMDLQSTANRKSPIGQ